MAYSVVEAFSHILKEIQRRMDQEAEMIRNGWSYEQVWLIPSESVKELPENPTFHDYVQAGAIFQGWQWVPPSDD